MTIQTNPKITQAICRLDNHNSCPPEKLETYRALTPLAELSARGSLNFDWKGGHYNLFCRNDWCTVTQTHEESLAWNILGAALTIASFGIIGTMGCSSNSQNGADGILDYADSDSIEGSDSKIELPILLEHAPECTSQTWIKQTSNRHFSVAPAKGGSFLTTSDDLSYTGQFQESSPIIQLFNSNGELQWKTQTHKDSVKTSAFIARYVAKSGYLLGGSESMQPMSTGKTYTYGLVIKIDESGSSMWRTKIPHNNDFVASSRVTSVVQLSEGVFASNAIYDQSEFPYTDVVILDDSNGSIKGQITKTLPPMLIEDMQRTAEGTIIAVGYTFDAFSKDPSFNALGRIVKFDTFGNVNWSTVTNTEASKQYSRVLQVEPFISGGYMVFGVDVDDVSKKPNLFTAKINDSDGSFSWKKGLKTGPLLAGNYNSSLMYNGAIAVVGITNTTPYVDQFDNNNLWITFLNGEETTTKVYAAPQMQVGGIVPVSDGLIIVGGRFSQGDGVIIKTDLDGNICKTGN